MDISTLIDKIDRGEIDLQPNFQRGQVWPDSKKRRLIDTILRQWYVPAIHLVVHDQLDKEEVLDGQQRLRAIIAFMNDEFAVDGTIEPTDATITNLDGVRYSDLPSEIKSRFKRFTIRTIRLRDYEPDEPGELFFRLNQLTALTAAEQRNALIGRPRNQIRRLASILERRLTGYSIGFSNARLNYDDTLSRLATTLEGDGLKGKLTSTMLEHRYRQDQGFQKSTLTSIDNAIGMLVEAVKNGQSNIRLNKASLFSWLYFIIDHKWTQDEGSHRFFFDFFRSFEEARASSSTPHLPLPVRRGLLLRKLVDTRPCRESIAIFNDRSSSRVNDTASVLLRDLTLNVCCFVVAPSLIRTAPEFDLMLPYLNPILDRLNRLPLDVAERAVEESDLAKQWETARANS